MRDYAVPAVKLLEHTKGSECTALPSPEARSIAIYSMVVGLRALLLLPVAAEVQIVLSRTAMYIPRSIHHVVCSHYSGFRRFLNINVKVQVL